MELGSGSVMRGASSSALQVNKVVKIQSLELAKVRKMEMEKQEEARRAQRESVRAEIEKRKKEREEIKKKEDEKNIEEERKLLKEMRQLSKDLNHLGKEIKKSGKLAVKQLSKLKKVETVMPLVEPATFPSVEVPVVVPTPVVPSVVEVPVIPSVEAPIQPLVEAAVVRPIESLVEGYSSRTDGSARTGTEKPYQSRAEEAVMDCIVKGGLKEVKGKGRDSLPESEPWSPTGVLHGTGSDDEFGSGLSCSSSPLAGSDDEIGSVRTVPVERASHFD